MALVIATNNTALKASASAGQSNRDMEISMARLSSGKRINSASNDAAGFSIASRLTANISGTDQAIRNALDGQALIDTAEGVYTEIGTILAKDAESIFTIRKRHQYRSGQSQLTDGNGRPERINFPHFQNNHLGRR